MTPEQIFVWLTAHQFKTKIEDGRLDVIGDIGLLTDGISEAIRANKSGLIDLLTRKTAATTTCPECEGPNIVTDSIGKYCIDCRRRPWGQPTPSPQPEPVYIGVKWAKDAAGHLELRDPARGETAVIQAKGLRSNDGIDLGWLFSRLPSKKDEWRAPKQIDYHGLDRDGFIADPEECTSVDDD